MPVVAAALAVCKAALDAGTTTLRTREGRIVRQFAQSLDRSAVEEVDPARRIVFRDWLRESDEHLFGDSVSAMDVVEAADQRVLPDWVAESLPKLVVEAGNRRRSDWRSLVVPTLLLAVVDDDDDVRELERLVNGRMVRAQFAAHLIERFQLVDREFTRILDDAPWEVPDTMYLQLLRQAVVEAGFDDERSTLALDALSLFGELADLPLAMPEPSSARPVGPGGVVS